MHCLYRSNMHVFILQTGVSAAVIYRDGDNEVQQELPLGISGNICAMWAQGGHPMALEVSMGPKGREEVSLSLHCLASLTGA